MDYEVIDKNGNQTIIKEVTSTYVEDRVLSLQINGEQIYYLNMDEIVSAIGITLTEEENNG